jgi:hypothetical protein
MNPRIARALVTSRPRVGSSRKRIFGSVMKPRQKFIFCLWPVERWLTRAPDFSARPTTSSIFAMRS